MLLQRAVYRRICSLHDQPRRNRREHEWRERVLGRQVQRLWSRQPALLRQQLSKRPHLSRQHVYAVRRGGPSLLLGFGRL